MRRSTAFALCLAALPLLASAKPVIDNEGYAYLTDNLLGGKVQQLQIQSMRWGGRQPAAQIEVQRKDLVAQDKMDNGPPPTGGNETITTGQDRTESATFNPYTVKKLQDRSSTTFSRPQGTGPGTLVVEGSLPGCTVGKRYGGMQFAAGGMRYELKDVVISACPTVAGPKEEITFVYGTVRVRGWDPKKKEE